MLSIFDSAEAVGLYGVPSKIFEVLASLSALFSGMMMPFFVAALGFATRDRLRETLTNALDVMFIFGMGVVTCCAGFAPAILMLISSAKFVPAAPALMFVAVAIASNAVSQPYRFLLTAMNLQHRAFKIDISCLAVAAVAYLALVPLFSYVGAGIGTAIVESTIAVSLAAALRREGLRGLIPSSWWKTLLAGTVAVVTMRSIASMHWRWVIGIVTGGLVYLGILMLMGAIPLNYLRAVINSPKSHSA